MNRRDIELLSAYLDGELKPSDSTILETRFKTDPELVSFLNELRSTRTLLHKLPSRKAPRNFTLTRKMVGQNPPLPRTYPIFRLATAVATLLLFFSFAANALGPQLAQPMNFGRGGGGAPEAEVQTYAEAPAMEEPSTESPAAAAPMAPAPTEPGVADSTAVEAPSLAQAPQGTQVPPTEKALSVQETPVVKNAGEDNAVGQPEAQGAPSQTSAMNTPPPLISSAWQIGLAAIAVLGLLMMGLMRQLSSRRWK